MKSTLFTLLMLFAGMLQAQSDWTFKPYVIVNDTLYENLKLPVFIMDSTLYIQTKEGKVLTFPSRDVNYISKRCLYDRVTPKQKNRLSRSIATSTYFNSAVMVSGLALLRSSFIEIQYIIAHGGNQFIYTIVGVGFGLGLVISSAYTIYKFIQRKRETKMILISKGLHFIPDDALPLPNAPIPSLE